MISGLPAGALAIAFGAVAAYARTHPYFANGRLVKTWHTWDSDTARPVIDIKTDRLPLVQARVTGGTTSKITSTKVSGGPDSAAYKVVVTVTWDVVVAGSNALDLLSLGELIRDVFHPSDRLKAAQLETALLAKNITDIRWNKPVVPELDGYYQDHLIGSGSMEMTINMV